MPSDARTADAIDERNFRALTDKISRDRGFRCANYKDKCVRRRIAVRMRARGVSRYADYAALLDHDPREYESLLDSLTINVTKFFRNPDVFDALARDIVPALWSGSGPIRIWSAGTASGEEAYSLAILFHRHAAALGELERLTRVSVLGTDIDRRSLIAARKGEYAASAFADTKPEIRERYFSGLGPWTVDPVVGGLVTFARHDLLGDVPPQVLPFSLIVCRNVIIYFDRAAQERVFDRFARSLLPGGTIVIGKVETLFGTARAHFTALDARARISRRNG